MEQALATEGIRENFGLQNALDYLIGQKLSAFISSAKRDYRYAEDLPAFLAEVRRLFTRDELWQYCDTRRKKTIAPPLQDRTVLRSVLFLGEL